MKENVCYKILYKKNTGTLWSFAKNALPSASIIRYFVSKETFPKIEGTPLFAFSSFKLALGFFESLPDISQRSLVIYECEYSEEIHVKKNQILCAVKSSSKDIVNFWNGKYGVYQYSHIPAGTIFVKSIKLIEQVYKHKEYRYGS
jgi:hypothetical protein